MVTPSRSAPPAEDLLHDVPLRRPPTATRRRMPEELANAHVLCRQLQRRPARREKQRIAHLICLNLLSLLKRRE